MIPARWTVAARPDPGATTALAGRLNIPEPLAAILVQRGLGAPDLAKAFLRPDLERLSDPLAWADMERAVELVARAVRAGTPILVHGDYDVDGQCAAALLTRVLRSVGGRVHAFVPHRLRDGYDFGPAGLAMAQRVSAGLIITCDCGISAVEAVRAARAAGIDVIVTDHHLPGDQLPPASAVLDPRRRDCASEDKDLCGAGVAFKLAQALGPALGASPNLPLHFLDYVALATVADVVPLTGENRILVRHGLKMLADSRWTGLRALVEAAGLAGRPVKSGHVGFILAPRLNAAGRIGEPADGLRLLLSDDPAAAAAIARELETLNARRQALDQRILDEAVELTEATLRPEDRALVLAADGWHPGVIGIVASRLVERYGRPAFLIGWDGDTGRGSGRSIAGFDLHRALHRVGTHLEKYGGHSMAAGLTIRRPCYEAFRVAFLEVAGELLGPDDLVPAQRVDLELPLGLVSEELEKLMRYLEPCGPGNPAPVFGVRGARAVGARRVGTNHLRFTLDDGSGVLPAIGFQWADAVPDAWLAQPLDVAFRLERDEWQGRTTLQARVASLAPSE
jgi:single-stranded-DNA-specific exonuclease